MMRRARRRQLGFTLFEALISVALVSTIIFAIGTVTSQWLPNWRYGAKKVQDSQLLDLGMQRLMGDVEASQFVTPFPEAKKPLFEGNESSLLLVRNAIGPNADPGLEIIRLAEAPDEGGLTLVRTRARFTPLSGGSPIADQLQFSDPVVLIHPPFRISFAYAGPDRVWRQTWHGSPGLPSAVRISVRDSVTNRTLSVSTTALIHVNVSAECVGQKSVSACATDGLATSPQRLGNQ